MTFINDFSCASSMERVVAASELCGLKTKKVYTPQTIVIIGAGAAGRTFAEGLATGHDKVILCDEDRERATNIAGNLKLAYPTFDVEAMDCFFNAAWEADVLILALSCHDFSRVAEKVREVANQKIVITTAPELETLEDLLPGSKVVEAVAAVSGMPDAKYGDREKASCIIRGKNAGALATTAALIERRGLNPVILPAVKQAM